MRIVFAGTPETAVPSLRALLESEHEVCGVITRPDAPLGRKRVMTPSPVAAFAEDANLPVLKTSRLDESATDWVAGLNPELGVIVAYGGLVRERLLRTPEYGWINLHFSELPRYRGAAPVQRALIDGDLTLGLTVFKLAEALDAGDVLSRDSHTFSDGTSAGEALAHLAEQGTAALLRAIELLEADPLAGEPQHGEASYAHKLTREDGKLNVLESTAAVLARWAGVTPEPGAYVIADDAPLKLLRVSPATAEPNATPTTDTPGEPGANLQTQVPGRVRLVSGAAILELTDGALRLDQVQPAGKAAMDGAAWLRGRGAEVRVK